MPLLDIWRDAKDSVLEMTINQIISTAGDGKLRDGSECATELRKFLMQVDRQYLKKYAHFCLDNSFQDSGFVLQDIINEVGRRLGFDIKHGLFRGKPNQNNADGIWHGDSWSFVIEVKTTDVYNMSLKKIASYLSNHGKHSASCLIVVGREETETLEDQLRGSRYNWDMRIIGVEALLKALELKEDSLDPKLGSRITDLLKPQEFTRVDQILLTAFDFATDREESDEEESSVNGREEAFETSFETRGTQHAEDTDTPTNLLEREQKEEFKRNIAQKIEEKFNINLIKSSRSSFESQPKRIRFIIVVSKPYEGYQKYWYGYSIKQQNYLREAENAYFVLGFLDSKKAFAIPKKNINILTSEMSAANKDNEDKKFYHVLIMQDDKGHYIYTSRNGQKFYIDKFEI